MMTNVPSTGRKFLSGSSSMSNAGVMWSVSTISPAIRTMSGISRLMRRTTRSMYPAPLYGPTCRSEMIAILMDSLRGNGRLTLVTVMSCGSTNDPYAMSRKKPIITVPTNVTGIRIQSGRTRLRLSHRHDANATPEEPESIRRIVRSQGIVRVFANVMRQAV